MEHGEQEVGYYPRLQIDQHRTFGEDATHGGAKLKCDTRGKRDKFSGTLLVSLPRGDSARTSALRGGHEPMADGRRNGHKMEGFESSIVPIAVLFACICVQMGAMFGWSPMSAGACLTVEVMSRKSAHGEGKTQVASTSGSAIRKWFVIKKYGQHPHSATPL